MKPNPEGRDLDGGMLIFGIIAGLLVGGLATLFNAPRSGIALRRQIADAVGETGHSLRANIEAVVPTDPVAESMAQGKAAARRRLEELGQN
ncbi:MAG: YtxH domain-containing protein [Anaerolineae bacterium]